MKNHHIAQCIALLSVAVILTASRTTLKSILVVNRLPSSDVFDIAANGSKSVFMYVRALLFTVPIDRDIIYNILAAREVVENAITECTLQNR